MAVHVWGVVEDRLIELRAEPVDGGDLGIRIEGLPQDRTRTTCDRVRAALFNCGLFAEAPSVAISLSPAVSADTASDLDVALALAVLACAGVVGSSLGWILATGRLGLDGRVHMRGLEDRPTLGEVVEYLCQTPLLEYERTFERGED